MTVRIFMVSTDDCDVSFEDTEYESLDSLIEKIEEENGEEDITCRTISELKSDLEKCGEGVWEGDVWFEKYEILKK